jgi:hypothetical protein
VDPLSLDILAETARGFFGARVQLDKKIALFNGFVEDLAQKAATVEGICAHLNYLLLSPQNASAFYAALKIPYAPFSATPKLSATIASANAGFALTVKGQFAKRLRWAYERLEQACRCYLHGTAPDNGDTDATPVYLGMIMKMTEVINAEISALNRSRPPSSTLQFAGQLNTEKQAKSATTGTPSQYADMDEKLGYALIDINALKIVRYAELPPLQTAAPVLHRFSDRLYAAHKKEIKALLEELRALSGS